MNREELSYPYNSDLIFQKRRHIKKELLSHLMEGKAEGKKLKIAILSGATIGQLKDIWELFLLDRGIIPEFYLGQYNRYCEDMLYNEELKAFAPDLVYIHTTVRTLEMNLWDRETVKDTFGKVWKIGRERFSCPIIQNNFEYIKDGSSQEREIIDELNQWMQQETKSEKGIYIQDIQFLSARFGLDGWQDDSLWYLYKYPFALEAHPLVCANLSNMLCAILGYTKKVLVVDLDNTLWGGVIGDDGVNGIELGLETPKGMAYSHFQSYVKRLGKEGIILAINSKNDKETALMGFTHPSSILEPEDFAAIRTNWQEKSTNLGEIIKELNILEESVVYVDDNPAECRLIEANYPSATVLCLNKIEDIVMQIEQAGYFYKMALSQEDCKRGEYYRQNRLRKEQEGAFESYQDYLCSLNMECFFRSVNESNLERVTQLINKTNQFNLTGKRYTKEELSLYLENENVMSMAVSLKDQFGDNGIVSVMILEKSESTLSIPLWVMSCRVFKRDLELAMFDAIVKYARNNGASAIKGQYVKTGKNHFVEKLFDNLGFSQMEGRAKSTNNKVADYKDAECGDINQAKSETISYHYIIPDNYENKNHVIHVIHVINEE